VGARRSHGNIIRAVGTIGADVTSLCRRAASVPPEILEPVRQRAAGLRPTIEALQASGVTSLQGMAAALNEAGIPTPRGKRQWHPVQVRRLLARL
jgi:hypothetical protein